MAPSILSLVERVIRTTSREHPADAVLREALKSRSGFSPVESAQASRAVFAYFRWCGWLDQGQPISRQIQGALQLADRFAKEPGRFSDADLVAHAVPAWLKDEMEITPAWARALQSEPKLWLRARPGQGTALAQKLGHCRPFGPGPLVNALVYQGHEDLFRTEEFRAGEFELQDLSSQAVGLICAPKAGQTWWDACAGEGGKLLHLSDLMENKGLIWASDRAAWRLQRLKRRAARARIFNYRAAPWDGSPRLPTKTVFDGVLLDAPCSGIGTWHRNPHARWTTTPEDVKELAELQKQLLIHAAPAVKPGGKLIYAACTLARSETTAVVEAFERQSPGFRPLAVRNPLQPEAVPAPRICFAPEQFGRNGMFVAAWVHARTY